MYQVNNQLERVLIRQLARFGISEQALLSSYTQHGAGSFVQFMKKIKRDRGKAGGVAYGVPSLQLPEHMADSQRSFGNRTKRRRGRAPKQFRPMGSFRGDEIGAPYEGYEVGNFDEYATHPNWTATSPGWASRPLFAADDAPQDEYGEKRFADDDQPFRSTPDQGEAPKIQQMYDLGPVDDDGQYLGDEKTQPPADEQDVYHPADPQELAM